MDDAIKLKIAAAASFLTVVMIYPLTLLKDRLNRHYVLTNYPIAHRPA
ncbi:hypothetical protein L533_2086 [Bordetella bronchiseptica OSU553]|nr:hypothetical protein L533_2086 [Bordetella bronchiseptica OSU553]